MARQITKEMAVAIAKKLGAVCASKKKNAAHELWVIYHNGQRVADFGIRRGSEKDKGHDFIPARLHLGPSRTKALAQCEVSKEEWIEEMVQKGQIAAPAENEVDKE